jgi:phosphoglycolate phosphatase
MLNGKILLDHGRIPMNQPIRRTRGIRLDNIEAMLFDFEGTLVDFQWQLSAAVAETLETLWNMGFAKDRILSRRYSTLMTEAMQVATDIGLSPDQVQEMIGCVYDRYDEDALTRWALRPGVKDFLGAIKAKGIRTGLVSNVGGKTLTKALSKLALTEFFDVALSRNDVLNLKPSPDGLNLAIERLGTSKDNSIFLGDSLDDLNAARNAGIRVMIITDGENVKEDIWAAKPDHVIKSYEELLPSELC